VVNPDIFTSIVAAPANQTIRCSSDLGESHLEDPSLARPTWHLAADVSSTNDLNDVSSVIFVSMMYATFSLWSYSGCGARALSKHPNKLGYRSRPPPTYAQIDDVFDLDQLFHNGLNLHSLKTNILPGDHPRPAGVIFSTPRGTARSGRSAHQVTEDTSQQLFTFYFLDLFSITPHLSFLGSGSWDSHSTCHSVTLTIQCLAF